MKAYGVTAEKIANAADTIGVRPYNVTEHGGKRPYVTFTLKTGERDERRIDWRGKSVLSPRYQRLSQRTRLSQDAKHPETYFNPVVPGAVCWHGHRDFMRALFALAPDAEIRSAMATYKGSDNFEQTFGFTRYAGGSRMGVQMIPYADACTCADAGRR